MERFGPTKEYLLSPTTQNIHPLDIVPNGLLVLELLKVKNDLQIENKQVCTFLIYLCEHPPTAATQAEKAITASLHRFREKANALLKSRTRATGQQALQAFLDSKYVLPKHHSIIQQLYYRLRTQQMIQHQSALLTKRSVSRTYMMKKRASCVPWASR